MYFFCQIGQAADKLFRMKVLILCTSSIGDIIFSTPLIRMLKVQLDEAEVHYGVPPDFFPVLEENPYLTKVLTLSGGWWERISKIRREKYDCIVDLEGAPFLWLCGSSIFRCPRMGWRHRLMTRFKINRLINRHVTDTMLLALRTLNLKSDDLGLDYFIPAKDTVPRQWLPDEFQKGFVVVSLYAPYHTRKLPVERVIELCDKINKPVIIVGAEGDRPAGEVIASFFKKSEASMAWEEGLQELNKKTVVYNACGKLNINQVASVIKQSVAVFTYDGDTLPIASAFRKNIFCIFGNTIPLFGRYPYKTGFTILENNRISCRPCSSKGFDKCPKGHFKCMQDIVFDFYVP